MSLQYSHTQSATSIRIVTVVVLIWFTGMYATIVYSNGFNNEGALGIQAAAVMLGVILYLLWDLTIQINDGKLIHWFGPRFWQRSYEIDSIKEVTPSSSTWWQGYGIRFVGDGWMYNVSGKDRIRIEFHSGKICYLGTDDMDELLAILNQQV